MLDGKEGFVYKNSVTEQFPLMLRWYQGYRVRNYDDRKIFIYLQRMYELVEVADGLQFNDITDNPIFPLDVFTDSMYGGYVHYVGGDFYILNGVTSRYKLVDGRWENMGVIAGGKKYTNTHGCTTDHYVIQPFAPTGTFRTKIVVVNPCDYDYKNIQWKEIKTDGVTRDEVQDMIDAALGGLESITNEILYN